MGGDIMRRKGLDPIKTAARRHRHWLKVKSTPELYDKYITTRRASFPRRREKHNKAAHERMRFLRELVINKLGGKCVSCGNMDYRVLQIDHINGGGQRERTSGIGYQGILIQIRDGTDDFVRGKYQLLCANCNWIKKFENRELNQFCKKFNDGIL